MERDMKFLYTFTGMLIIFSKKKNYIDENSWEKGGPVSVCVCVCVCMYVCVVSTCVFILVCGSHILWLYYPKFVPSFLMKTCIPTSLQCAVLLCGLLFLASENNLGETET